jgi:hypothetical protein
MTDYGSYVEPRVALGFPSRVWIEQHTLGDKIQGQGLPQQDPCA